MTMTDGELTSVYLDEDPWAGTGIGTDRNPFEPGTEHHAEYDRQVAAEREATLAVRRRQQLADETDRQLIRLRARRAADEILGAEDDASRAVPAGTILTDFLNQPFEPTRFRIDGLWPRRGNVVLAAAYKAGKTTLRDNLVRTLVDGGKFLGLYDVDQVTDGRVGVLDFEMPPNKLQEWLRDQDIGNTDRVMVWSLRGRGRLFDPRDDRVRSRWAEQLKTAEVRVLVVDCLGPILSALGLNENEQKEVGAVLDALTSLVEEAGVDELLLIHHMGHGAERSRGASRLRDWPDAEWRLVRQKDEDNPFGDPDPAAPRFFSAFGRDVEIREGQLVFDKAARRLVYAEGNRREARAGNALAFVLAWVRDHPNATVRGVQDEAARHDGLSRDVAREAIKQAVAQGLLKESSGPNRSKMHTVTAGGFAHLAGPGVAPVPPPGAAITACFGCYRPVEMPDSGTAWCSDCATTGGAE